jgi:membrane fusion protein (multidrug efflux system)
MNTSAAPHPHPRARLLTAAAMIFAVLGGAYAVWWSMFGSRYESTDNAYVRGNLVQITPQIAGTVLAIETDDTRMVTSGQILARIDSADADVALAQAEADLGRIVRQARARFEQDEALLAQVEVRKAEIARAQADLNRAQSDLKRRQELARAGGVSGEEILHAQTALKNAESGLAQTRAALASAQAELATNQAYTHGTSVADHPDVRAAATAVRAAWLARSRTAVPAPVDGQVARRAVQVGQRVSPGSVLMNVVPLDQLWVEANFKEGQLRKMRAGQPVTLTADLYGDGVVYRGVVSGLDAATGSAAALLPAQNATGNWIKVVQRVPVRIALDPADLKQHPLRIGLSMQAKVDIGAEGGAITPAAAGGAMTTKVFDFAWDEADARIARVIAANLQ